MQNGNAVSLKKVSPHDFQKYNHFKYEKICSCARMLVLERKERAFLGKAGLSLRARGREFSPAAKRMAPGYFYWKIEEK